MGVCGRLRVKMVVVGGRPREGEDANVKLVVAQVGGANGGMAQDSFRRFVSRLCFGMFR